MVIGFKDAVKLIGVTVITFCAVFVCTFFLNFRIDAQSIKDSITGEEAMVLYNAQMSTAKFTCAISGGFLGLIAVVMLVFYIKLYIADNSVKIGLLKAMGYSDASIALQFSVFGVSVFIGTALGFCGGFAMMPTVYNSMTIAGLPEIAINFHIQLLILLVVVPTLVFSGLACLFAFLYLRRPVNEILRGVTGNEKTIKKRSRDRARGFLAEMCFKTITSKKLLAFFVAFACFCFSAMIQMAVSMYELSTVTMGVIIFVLGIVISVTSVLIAVTTVINANKKNVAMMKAFGYSLKDCALSVLGGYHIFAAVGFALGTVYQFGLLKLMVDVVYIDVLSIPDYGFNVPVFFITLAAFVVFYEAVMFFYVYAMSKISVKEVMTEN